MQYFASNPQWSNYSANVKISSVIQANVNVGMNKYELEQEQFAANGTVFILAFSPNTKLAINASSEQSDYAVRLDGSGISFVKLNNVTKWRFAFKVIIRRSYYSSVLTLKEKFGFGQVPQSVQWFSIGLNRSDDYSLQILYEKNYRFIGNLELILYSLGSSS